MRGRRTPRQFFQRHLGVAAVALAVLLVAPAALAAPGGGAPARPAPTRVPHLPAELARLHAEALRDAPKAAPRAASIRPATSRASAQAAISLGTPSAIGGDQRLVVSWTPPNGGIPGVPTIRAFAFDVTSPTVVAGMCTSPSSGYNCSIGGLINGHKYTSQVETCDNSGTCYFVASVAAATVARWPDPVSNLTVAGGDDSITASWAPPANNGGLPVDHYVAEAYPATSSWCYPNAASLGSLDVTSNHVTFNAATLARFGDAPVNGKSYVVTVFPVNDTADGYTNGNDDCYPNAGTGQDVTSSPVYADPQATAQSGQPGQYTPIAPVSLLGSGGTVVTGGSTVQERVLGTGAVPASGVAAVTLGVSVTGSAGAEVYVWSSDASHPFNPTVTTSAVAVTPGYEAAAGTVTVPVGASGAVSVNSSLTATIHLDVLGYYQDGSLSAVGSQYVGVTPSTLYSGTVTSAASTSVTAWNDGSTDAISPWNYGGTVVRAGSVAAVVDVTLSGSSTYGSLTVSGTTATLPDAPTLFYPTGQYTSAITTVPIASDGTFQLSVSAGTAAVVVSVIGYYTGPRDPAGGDLTTVAQSNQATSGVRATVGGGSASSVTVPWPATAPAASGVLTEWMLISYQPSTAGTLSVYPTGNTGAAVNLVISPQGNAQALIPVPRTASGGSVTIAALYGASAAVDVDVVGYTLLGSVPQQPGDVYAAPVAGGAYITWFEPCVNGASPVYQYEIVASPGGATMTVDGTQSSAFMDGLTDGTSYQFEVLAINTVGDGPASPWTPAVTPEPTAPDPPDQPGAQAGDSSALVSWDTPGQNGDSPITGYTITGDINGQAELTETVTGAATHQLVMTGLANGTTYSFQVEATNAIGTSDPSVASILVTPTAGASIAPALARLTAVKVPAATPVTACQPVAALPKAPAASAEAATTRQYQLGDHVLTEITPPASLDIGTASLATLHKYNYALQIKTTAALRAWQRRIGHSHPVPVVPCIAKGLNPGGAHAKFSLGSCTLTVYGLEAATPYSANPVVYHEGPGWSGLIADAHSLPKPPVGAVLPTGDAFQAVEGEWQQTTNASDPGGTNILSSWVGIGGWGSDPLDPTDSSGLIQAGTDMQTNNTLRFWWEVIGWDNSEPAISVSGISGNRTDAIDVSVVVLDADKDYPQSPRAQADFQAGIDNGLAVFNWIDTTNGQSATFEVGRIYTDYSGRTAEWINESPISGATLAALPQFAPIKWLAAIATASYNQPFIDSGTPYLWNKEQIGLYSNGVCVAGPTNINMTQTGASWTYAWHPGNCRSS